ncbi:hypothetical protein SAMN05444277_12116 [Parafilimonas terrae]|uniref:Uncharacterized protein n=1 Tax=Parafilimonas terrae TaxID=1465490 RepID=A0A1I5ZER1_9BACT|nr:hypothetical protein SAMN05444277_12116 [Parafilimonas terrae]
MYASKKSNSKNKSLLAVNEGYETLISPAESYSKLTVYE